MKVLKKKRRDEAPAVRGLKREIMVMSMIQHPNILAVVALGTQADGVPFVVLEKLHSVLDKQLPSAKGGRRPDGSSGERARSGPSRAHCTWDCNWRVGSTIATTRRWTVTAYCIAMSSRRT